MRSMLITGCRTGLGLELVKQFLVHPKAKPDVLIATCRKIADAPELQELAKRNKNLHLLELDVTEYDKYEDFSSKVADLVGDNGLNVLFHNAGILFHKEANIDLVEADKLIAQFHTNTIAPIMMTKALLPLLRTAAKCNSSKPLGVDRAAIICMSSVLGSVGCNDNGGYWGYRESKAAANIAMRSMTAEFEKDGIATLALHPGWVRTQMGGPNATLTTEQSVNGLLPIILGLEPGNNGAFYEYTGKTVPW